MTVFIVHATDDAEAAMALESFLERRGHFAHREDGSESFRPLARADVVVMLWSAQTLVMSQRLLMERRALDAWAEARLVSLNLDHGLMPVGLRDLKIIDAPFAPQRDIAFAAVNKAIQDAMADARRLEAELERSAAPRAHSRMEVEDQAPQARRTPNGRLWAWVLIGVVLLGAALGAASLLAGVSWRLWAVLAGAAAVCALAAVAAVAAAAARQDEAQRKRLLHAPPKGTLSPPKNEAGDGLPGLVFMSFALPDAAVVGAIVDELELAGQTVRMDPKDAGSDAGWSGEIIRAVQAAATICVICSKAAFESDHVKREIYLADRYRRPLTPIFIDDVVPPADFAPFFEAARPLKLADLPNEGRGAALAQALTAR